jgi:hypothetical protein
MFFIVIGYSALSIYLYGSNTSKVPADAAIVLGAAAWGDKPSPVSSENGLITGLISINAMISNGSFSQVEKAIVANLPKRLSLNVMRSRKVLMQRIF